MLEIKAFADPEHNIVILRPEGSIDSTTVGDVKKAITELIEEGCRYLIVEFASVDYISSAGWGIILGRLREFRDREGDIYLVEMRPPVFSVFQLMGLDTVITYFNTLPEAGEKFGLRKLKEVPVTIGIERRKEAESVKIDFEQVIKQMVIKNPLWGAKEIMKALNQGDYGIPSVSWFKVYNALKKMGLHTQKRRLLFVVSKLKKR